MNKQEKQKMMIDGAVFALNGKTYSLNNDNRFSYYYDDKIDEREKFCIIEGEWEQMTLKNPAPKKEYSREYEIIPPDEMARLMYKEGLTLEMENGFRMFWDNGFYDGNDNPLVNEWGTPCRVRQEPKTETRYFWELENENFTMVTKEKYTEQRLLEKYAGDFTKLIGSEEDFPIEDK